LPNNERGIHILMGRIYAVEMGSGAMTYIPSLKNIGSAIQKLIRGTHRQHGDRISPISFFKIREVC
jgi:hypothetical protein